MSSKVVIVGAGMGGLSAAMRLASHGCDVTVLDRAEGPGGKMRAIASDAGPVDAGPTVLTLRDVFEDLFDTCGTSLSAHVTLERLTVLARHHWEDGSSLDLFADHEESLAAVETFAGAKAAREFADFHMETGRLFDAFEGPMMQAAAPTLAAMTGVVLSNPGLIPAMSPGRTMARALAARFSDPRMRQLFGRYATYVGGSPLESPALLSLIWQAESRGVWSVQGGMNRLANAMCDVAESAGAAFRFRSHVDRIEVQNGRAVAVHASGKRHAADRILFNGDPRALQLGLLGENAACVPRKAVAPRSLSAFVWSFAAEVTGHPPAHHNVFFAQTPNSEFPEIAADKLPSDPTLYVCAQDRGNDATPTGAERFEIIINGPPRKGVRPDPEEQQQCQETTFQRLARMGLTFNKIPDATLLTTPEQFNALFPASEGSLYGRSPHGMMAAFQRPTARTALPGLYLAGGGAHPGAGVPMATTSGRLAAEAILTDLASTSTSRPPATAGGTSTASARTARAPSR